jgi:hypothetical protein
MHGTGYAKSRLVSPVPIAHKVELLKPPSVLCPELLTVSAWLIVASVHMAVGTKHKQIVQLVRASGIGSRNDVMNLQTQMVGRRTLGVLALASNGLNQ